MFWRESIAPELECPLRSQEWLRQLPWAPTLSQEGSQKSWCCELGNFSRRCSLQRNRRAVWSEVKGHVGGAKLTVTCRGRDTDSLPGHRHLAAISWLRDPFLQEHRGEPGDCPVPLWPMRTRKNLHTPKALSLLGRVTCVALNRNARTWQKIWDDWWGWVCPLSPSSPDVFRGLVHHLVCLLSSQSEKEMLGLHLRPFKQKKIQWKTKCFTLVENIRKPTYFNWLQIWQTIVAD